jgi:hypothetical protein
MYTHGVRRETSVEDSLGGPGSYNPTKPFGHQSRSFVIGEIKESHYIVSAGPGEYNHERADSLTKTKSREVEIMPYSKTMLQITDSPGPGYYNYAD